MQMNVFNDQYKHVTDLDLTADKRLHVGPLGMLCPSDRAIANRVSNNDNKKEREKTKIQTKIQTKTSVNGEKKLLIFFWFSFLSSLFSFLRSATLLLTIPNPSLSLNTRYFSLLPSLPLPLLTSLSFSLLSFSPSSTKTLFSLSLLVNASSETLLNSP